VLGSSAISRRRRSSGARTIAFVVAANLAVEIVREALRDEALRGEILKLVRDALAAAPANDVPEPLIDAKAAAEMLGMTVPAVRASAYRGSIPCQRVGRLLRFRRSDLLRRRP
jgi:hypothetical protein